MYSYIDSLYRMGNGGLRTVPRMYSMCTSCVFSYVLGTVLFKTSLLPLGYDISTAGVPLWIPMHYRWFLTGTCQVLVDQAFVPDKLSAPLCTKLSARHIPCGCVPVQWMTKTVHERDMFLQDPAQVKELTYDELATYRRTAK